MVATDTDTHCNCTNANAQYARNQNEEKNFYRVLSKFITNFYLNAVSILSRPFLRKPLSGIERMNVYGFGWLDVCRFANAI